MLSSHPPRAATALVPGVHLTASRRRNMPNLRPIHVICCASLLCGYAGRSDTLAADPEQLGRVAFEGEILEDRDLSGAAIRGDLLVIGSDERSAVQILR